VSRILAVFLLPLYTSYLAPGDFGQVGVLIALSAVVVTVLRGGVQSAFFRFYFDSKERAARLLVLRTSFWYTMTAATLGLLAGVVFAPQIGRIVGVHDSTLVAAAFVGVWAQMNWEQLTSLFRVEERSVAYVIATLMNLFVTIAATVLLVVGFDKGAMGVVVGNWTGTLIVYVGLLGYRREQLGLQFSRKLLRSMQKFGWPLVPAALALIGINFADRFFLVHLSGLNEVGKYELGVRIASAMVLLLTAFRTAWPAFAYSLDDEREAKRTYAFVLTYLVFISSWLALGLGALAPWLVRLLSGKPAYWDAKEVVGLLAFGTTFYSAYIVMAIGVGRTRKTQFNWIITGIAAIVNFALCLALIPAFGMVGAAIATLAAYVALFLCMTFWAQRIYPVRYQWVRLLKIVGLAGALSITTKLVHAPLALAIAITVAYPFLLALTGFYLPAERRRLRSIYRPRARYG
jgi:O-antigen/teichoic acid export membrane protein